jgi:uncharacterized protein
MNDTVKKPEKKNLPLHAKASSALAREATYAGLLPVSRLERLSAAISGVADDLDVSLKIRRDANRAPKLEGAIQGALPMVCQRCLRTFAWPLDIKLDLRLVFNEEEENRVLKDAEPFLVSDDTLMFHAIVEEEVLLALPYAPRCEQADCEPG